MKDDDFDSEQRRALRATVRAFIDREVAPNLADWEAQGAIPRELHRAAGAVGLLSIGYPESIGGSGGNWVDVTVLTEEFLAAGGSGGLFAGLFSHGIALPHVIDAAGRATARGDTTTAEKLSSEWIKPVLTGDKIAALAVTEPDGGSDVARLRTRAQSTDSGWVLNGTKTFITSGARADLIVVAARTGQGGAEGISLFAVDPRLPGFSVSRTIDKMGWWCSDTAELAFVDCQLPPHALLTAEPGGGFASLATHFAAERLSLATVAYSTAARCFDLTMQWCRQRSTFGRPLASRQVVRHQLVEMYRLVDVARTYTRAVAVRHSRGESVLLDAVLAKNTAVDVCTQVVDQAVQLHGGFGYTRDSEVERHYRDARILGIGGGATEVMTDLAAKLLEI